ncbi:MAG: hypothetical protein PF630_03975 [Gammaproteobacteria bacterium]|nr:hypothetical protein [Gammaproteobacteria bacterium]
MSTYNQPLRIAIVADQPRRLAAMLIMLLTLVAVFSSGLPWWMQGLVLLAIGGYLMQQWSSWRRMTQWHCLQRQPSGAWQLINQQGDEQALQPARSHLLSPWLVIVHGSCAGKPVHLWFWRHLHNAESFRRLSVYLKYNQIDDDIS